MSPIKRVFPDKSNYITKLIEGVIHIYFAHSISAPNRILVGGLGGGYFLKFDYIKLSKHPTLITVWN